MKNHNIIIFITLIALIFVGYFLGRVSKQRETDTLVSELTDSIKIWKDKNGKSKGEIKVIETKKISDFLKVKIRDSLTRELIKLVKENRKMLKYKGSATIIKTETVIDTIVKTVVIKDTNNLIYKGSLKTKWFNIQSTSSLTETRYNLKTFSKLNLIIGQKREKFYKPLKTFAVVNDENPYTNIKDMRVYNIKVHKSKFIFGPTVNYGFLIGKDNGFKSGIFVGIGLTYNLIQF